MDKFHSDNRFSIAVSIISRPVVFTVEDDTQYVKQKILIPRNSVVNYIVVTIIQL